MSDKATARPQTSSSTEAAVRTLRHEVGDLLQSIYAAVAILRLRVPPNSPESQVLSDLRRRSEMCRDLIDVVHDLYSPITLQVDPVDIREVIASAVSAVATRYPKLNVSLEGAPTIPEIIGDARRLAQAANTLLTDACSTAEKNVVVRVDCGESAGEVVWQVTDDGPGVPPNKEKLLFNAFTTTPHGHLGPGLALVRRLVELHGGKVVAGNRPGGFRVEVKIPTGTQAIEKPT
jgi:signal transduction histidine kinase